MPQILKDDLRLRILDAAGAIFAERGFEAARIADIAERAGTSASNVYKYVKDKTDLFHRVLPAERAAEHRRLLSARLGEFEIRTDWQAMDAQRSREAGDLLAFWVTHRHIAAILMGRAAGTAYEAHRGEMVAEMTGRAVLRLGRQDDPHLRFVLEQVFTRTLDTLAAILIRYETAEDIRTAVAHFWRFQLAGLEALLTASRV
ncbi:UNVERIFIED_ORG: TetR/AcrR family transcriptional regulator (plasmid) [Roseateles sp. XES5]|nr:TetR/AcrR family transcriptional regulator [Roseateles sp. XES5]